MMGKKVRLACWAVLPALSTDQKVTVWSPPRMTGMAPERDVGHSRTQRLAGDELLRDLDVPVAHKVVLQINSDEEVGSESSRALTEKGARRSTAVLVLEPGADVGSGGQEGLAPFTERLGP